MRKFSIGNHGRQRLEFFPAPHKAPLRAFAALVIPWIDGKVLICDIEGRGWSIPSGRVEPDETSPEAAAREALEEAGAILADIQYLGCYRVTERRDVRWADIYVSRVGELVPVPTEFESHGRRLAALEELPTLYHTWSDMLAEIFQYSAEVLCRHEKAMGIPSQFENCDESGQSSEKSFI